MSFDSHLPPATIGLPGLICLIMMAEEPKCKQASGSPGPGAITLLPKASQMAEPKVMSISMSCSWIWGAEKNRGQ